MASSKWNIPPEDYRMHVQHGRRQRRERVQPTTIAAGTRGTETDPPTACQYIDVSHRPKSEQKGTSCGAARWQHYRSSARVCTPPHRSVPHTRHPHESRIVRVFTLKA